MKEKLKSNNGFTLIELVIAIAMLAFIMAAVSAFMGSSVLTFRKTKANIAVQNTAQETYDQISDSIMQAQRIVVHGYLSNTNQDFGSKPSGDNADAATLADYYFVANTDVKTEYEDAGITNVKLFSEINDDEVIYVKDMVIDVSELFHGDQDTYSITNQFTGNTDIIKYSGKNDADGNKIYDTNNTIRRTYTFVDSDNNRSNLYYEKTDAYGIEESYTIAWSDSNSMLYGELTNSVKWLQAPSGEILHGCVFTVDTKNGAIGLNMYFEDKNITYDTTGMIKVRNSNVLENH